MELLYRKHGGLKAKIKVFETFMDDLKYNSDKKINECDLGQLKQRFERFSLVFDEFQALQSEAENVATDDDIWHLRSAHKQFENNYYDISARAQKIIRSNADDRRQSLPKSSGETHVTSELDESSQAKSPIPDFPKFNGEFVEWLEFRDNFISMIHENASMTDTQKRSSLRSSLEGDARRIIAGLQITGKNYSIAWDMLCDRYNNPKMLIQNHVKALFGLAKPQVECSHNLRKLIDDVNRHVRSLKSLEEPSWDTLMIYLISCKLPGNINEEWERAKRSISKPVLDDIINVVKERASLLESLQ